MLIVIGSFFVPIPHLLEVVTCEALTLKQGAKQKQNKISDRADYSCSPIDLKQ